MSFLTIRDKEILPYLSRFYPPTNYEKLSAPNCTLGLYGVIHALLLSYLLTILKTSSLSLMKVSTFSQMSKKCSLRK
jgi:hypothetical protein